MRTFIAHGHIFKNAGATFDWALGRNFGEGFCDHRDDERMRLEGAPYLVQYLQDNPHIDAISFHHVCVTSGIEGIDIVPVYMLRHPIERIVSVYNFERKQASSTPGAIAAKNVTLETMCNGEWIRKAAERLETTQRYILREPTPERCLTNVLWIFSILQYLRYKTA